MANTTGSVLAVMFLPLEPRPSSGGVPWGIGVQLGGGAHHGAPSQPARGDRRRHLRGHHRRFHPLLDSLSPLATRYPECPTSRGLEQLVWPAVSGQFLQLKQARSIVSGVG
jgi:hypothetical protein